MSLRRRSRKRRPYFIVVPVVLLVAAVVGIIAYSYSQSASAPHFPFPCLQNEALFYHVHPWLRIVVNGENVTIPTAVGIANPVIQQGLAGGGPDSCLNHSTRTIPQE